MSTLQKKKSLMNNSSDMLDAAFRPFAEWLCELADIQSGSHVIDLGAGTGVSTLTLLQKTLPDGHVVAVDPDIDAIKQLHIRIPQKDQERLTITKARAEDLKSHFPNQKFDSVISNFSFHLFDDQSITLDRIHNLLKPCGTLAFSVPGALHVKEFRKVLMTVLDKLGLRESFSVKGPLVPDKEIIEGWCRSDENSWEYWKMEEKKISLNCSSDEYIDHMFKRGGAKRILRRLPEHLRQGVWDAVKAKMKEEYSERNMSMTLHALAVYSKKVVTTL